MFIFSTSRAINILNTTGNIYGLDPEIAWNYGVSYLQGFNLFGRKADIILDYYKTDFKNQVVVDYENPLEVNFYNLEGNSYANSFQAEMNYNVFENFDLRLAYKYYDVKTDYNSGKLENPLVPKHRLFANVSYETPLRVDGSQWKFDTTYNWLGRQRYSSTASNPTAYKLPEYTPTLATLNAQVTKVFSPKFEIYLGGENITNVRQSNPVLGADNPVIKANIIDRFNDGLGNIPHKRKTPDRQLLQNVITNGLIFSSHPLSNSAIQISHSKNLSLPFTNQLIFMP